MPHNPCFLAVDLGGTKVTAGLVRAKGKVVERITEAVDASNRLAPVRQIARLSDALHRAAPRLHARAAGIAVPGLVRHDGTVWAPNLPGWHAVPLARMLRQKLHIPVTVESDRNAGVLGEVWQGAARGASDAIVLMLGTGIGAGIWSGGRLVRGAHELSGCAGWMAFTDRSTSEAQRCGQLESLAAGPAMARAARASSLEALASAARSGDRKARNTFERAGRALGLAVANLISLFDPEVVILTGGVAQAADLFLPVLRSALPGMRSRFRRRR